MAGRVGVDVVAAQWGRAQGCHAVVGCRQIVDHDVEVDLLGDGGVGPGRWAVVGGPLEGDAGGVVVGGHYREVVVGVGDRVAQQVAVEGGQGQGVGAVKDHVVETAEGHAHHLCPSRLLTAHATANGVTFSTSPELPSPSVDSDI